MDKSKVELQLELKELKKKYLDLREKYTEETTILKKNEEELRLKLLFLEGVANSAIYGFLVVNTYGQKILQNQRTIDLWKIPQEVVDDPSGLKQISHVMHMAVNPQQFVAEIDYLREHPDEKSRDELELIDGTILERYSSPVLGVNGENFGRIWTFHDITKRKLYEQQLKQLNTDKDRFISVLAHDLRNPFSSLLGFSSILQKKLAEYPFDKTKEMVDIICSIAHSTYGLLEDTLLWANVRSKNLTFSPKLINTSKIISEVANMLLPGANTKNISIKYNDINETNIFADVYMFKAVLRNLISNAIKFSNSEGTIEISVIPSSSEVTIEICDHGVGISSEIIDKLFKFSSTQSSKGTANELGTGLGLMLCKEFVDKHAGKIWIESKINKGTKVSFSLPNQK